MRRRRQQTKVAILLAGAVLSLLTPAMARAEHGRFVDKLERGSVSRVSVSSSGEPGDAPSGKGCSLADRDFSASDDGRYIAFTSEAGNLDPADANGSKLLDVFVHDRKKSTTKLVSGMSSGLASDLPPALAGPSCYSPGNSMSPAMSGNGRFVAFVSRAPIVELDDLEAAMPGPKVFVHDLKTGSTELVSRTWDGKAALVDDHTNPEISDDGRIVAFTSPFPGMTEGQGSISCSDPLAVASPQICSQAYVRNIKRDETILASRSDEGVPANYDVRDISLSDDGTRLAFDTHASNLVDNDANQLCTPDPGAPSCSDVFLHDLRDSETQLVSESRDGVSASGASELNLTTNQVLSSDGRFVTFLSSARDLVPNNPPYPTNGSMAFVRDMKRGRVERVSVTSAGELAIEQSGWLSITDNGRYVMWYGAHCLGSNYPVNTTPPCDHPPGGAFVHDRRTGQVDWLHADVDWRQEPPPAHVGRELVGNGRFLLDAMSDEFSGDPSDQNGVLDIFVRDIGETGMGVRPTTQDRASTRGSLGTLGSLVRLVDQEDDSMFESLGGEIIGGRVVARPELNDLYVRLDLERLPMPAFGIQGIPLLIGFRFVTSGAVYELRSTASPPPLLSGNGHFAFYRCETGSCERIGGVRGGYGTIGESIVAAIPLHYFADGSAADVFGLQAFTALASSETGPLTSLDEANVGRTGAD